MEDLVARNAASARAVDPDRVLRIVRVFDAPRTKVFEFWTDARLIARWIGPRTIKRVDVPVLEARKGGAYRIVMHGESGGTHVVRGVYREVAPPERLAFTWSWEDDAGRPKHESIVTVTLRALGPKRTEMTLHHEVFESKDSRDSHAQGWGGSFDKLAERLVPAD